MGKGQRSRSVTFSLGEFNRRVGSGVLFAERQTCGVEIATLDGSAPIPEIGIAAERRLDEMHDVHFGVSDKHFNKVVTWELRDLGARALDISRRGGRTAEDTWRWLNKGWIKVYCCLQACQEQLGTIHPTKIRGLLDNEFYCSLKPSAQDHTVPEIVEGHSDIGKATVWKCPVCKQDTYYVGTRDTSRMATPDFQKFFDEFNRSKAVTKSAFSPSAKMGGKSIAGTPKYKANAASKYHMDQDSPLFAVQYGTRWSKAALEHVVENKLGNIHFHLDGLGDISAILDKRGDYSHNVTGRELRYVWRNWERFKDFVVFYNGYTYKRDVVVVETPWN